MNRTEKLRHKIESTFAPVSCQIEDESALHAGHAGAASGGGHYKMLRDLTLLIKNHHTETASHHDDGFFFVRIQMAMRLHVSARLQRVQQAVACCVIVAVEIVILTQTRTVLRSFGGLREQVGIDDGDAHKIFLKNDLKKRKKLKLIFFKVTFFQKNKKFLLKIIN